MGILRRLRERTGVRAASALAAALSVAMVLVVAGAALVLLLDQTLTSNTRASTEDQATILGERIAANFSGTGDAKRNAVDATGKRNDIVQVVTAYSDESNAPDWMVGPNGDQEDVQVLGASDPLEDQDPIVDWLLVPGDTRVEEDVPIRLSDADGTVVEAMVVGVGFRANGRPITVYAAQELTSAHSAVETVGWLVLFGVPVLVLVSGFFTYLFAGRALRPVEEMRAQVAGMGEKDLSGRVPEPVARDEVGRLARTMNQMLGRIESSQATQRRFVADASHELRSPLATVSTGLELLGTGMPEDSADRATVQTLRGEASRLTSLVEGLLFLARADERGLAPRREEVDLDEIAEAERARPAAPATAGSAAIEIRVTTAPVRVVGDRGQLVRVLRNLVDNARRHASSVVAVSVRESDGVAVIDVDDDGAGVPEADRGRVFERFVRLDEARSRGDGGSGLGLSIVAELVAAHGGTVAALQSPELGGARFRVTVPAVVSGDSEIDSEIDPDPDLDGLEPDAIGSGDTGPGDDGSEAGRPGGGTTGGPAAGRSAPPVEPVAAPSGAGAVPVAGGAAQAAADPGELRDDRPSGPIPRITFPVRRNGPAGRGAGARPAPALPPRAPVGGPATPPPGSPVVGPDTP
ncbi:ATP-binding protein, partial [Pseudonocardia nematodicida]